MHTIIQKIYNDIEIRRWDQFQTTSIKEVIARVSKKTGLPTYFFNYPSELNNLGGEWRIFLNQNQNEEQIWQDYGKKIGVYICYHLFLDGKATDELKDFFYYFCVPQFLLEQVPLSEYKHDEEFFTKEIARIFHVDYKFAESRIRLICAS
ncbi:hypothetical protein ACA30_13075 [Virgibacillus soli]|nr:hypothetical protein ACA30_13075 [Virgibacillus soli]